jgi:hypothetical protein
MKKNTLKEKLFRTFGKELAAAGATKANTKIKRTTNPKPWGSSSLTYLGKLGRRFAALVPKVAGAVFVIWVSVVPLIPISTPILVPKDNTPVMIEQATQNAPVWTTQFPKTPSRADFKNVDPSGSMQIYVSLYGIKLPTSELKPDVTYDILPGTRMIFVTREFNSPPNYIPMITGSMIG